MAKCPSLSPLPCSSPGVGYFGRRGQRIQLCGCRWKPARDLYNVILDWWPFLLNHRYHHVFIENLPRLLCFQAMSTIPTLPNHPFPSMQMLLTKLQSPRYEHAVHDTLCTRRLCVLKYERLYSHFFLLRCQHLVDCCCPLPSTPNVCQRFF